MLRRSAPPAPAPDIPVPPRAILRASVERALAEDLSGAGDLTSEAIAPPNARMRAAIVSRARGCIAGVAAALETFTQVDEDIKVDVTIPDGGDVTEMSTVMRLEGPARSVLGAERTALNFLTHLSGIATLTKAFVREVDGALARIVGTRKTTPGLRALENHAIRCGGGGRHRYHLSDAILIKDNHIAVAGGVAAALMAVRARAGHMAHVSVEVDDLAQVEEALRYSPDVILLDNFEVATMAEAVRLIGGRCTVEVSGGVRLETVRAIADTGVDVISIGALTHSAPSLDLGLDVVS